MMRFSPILALFALACADASPPTAQEVVDSAIAWQGGEILNNAEMTFDFRDRQFRVYRSDGMFEYERVYSDTLGRSVREVLSNDGLIREIDGQLVELDSAAYASAETSVNSVVYFAVLPLPLNDPGAIKRLLGVTDIDGRSYHELEVTFTPEGGGRDYDDRFVYWIDAETGALDYLAYYYHVDEGGSRFREAFNLREIAGVKVADYYNYKAESIGIADIQRYESLYAAGRLELVSEVVLENVVIRSLGD